MYETKWFSLLSAVYSYWIQINKCSYDRGAKCSKNLAATSKFYSCQICDMKQVLYRGPNKIFGVIDCLTLVLLFFLVKQQLCPLLFCLFLSYTKRICNEQFRIFCRNLYDLFKNRKFFSQQPEWIFSCHCTLYQWWKFLHFYCCPHSG